MMLQPNPRRRPATLRRRRYPWTDRGAREHVGRAPSASGVFRRGAISACPPPRWPTSTDDYPIPHRMIVTTCTAEQILAAARDFTPIYYQRYMIDKHNKPPGFSRPPSTVRTTSIHSDPADRRAYSEQMVDQLCRSRDAGVAQLGEDLLQQQGRRRKRDRPLRRVPTRRPIRVGLVARYNTSETSGNLTAGTVPPETNAKHRPGITTYGQTRRARW